MARTLLESKINLIEPETIKEEVDLMKVDFDELNKGATAELKKLLKNMEIIVIQLLTIFYTTTKMLKNVSMIHI